MLFKRYVICSYCCPAKLSTWATGAATLSRAHKQRLTLLAVLSLKSRLKKEDNHWAPMEVGGSRNSDFVLGAHTMVLLWHSRQTSGFVTPAQLLCLLQLHWDEQLSPTKPKWHWQTPGDTHVPFTQPCAQTGSHWPEMLRQRGKWQDLRLESLYIPWGYTHV